jgi:hypothetical protein
MTRSRSNKLKRSTASFHKSKQPEAKKYPAPFKKRAMYEAHEVRFPRVDSHAQSYDAAERIFPQA